MEQVKVKCVQNNNVQDRLTIGKIYDVIGIEQAYKDTKFYVYNDQNKLDWYLGHRFEIVGIQTIELRKEPIKSATQCLEQRIEEQIESKTDRKIRLFETGAIRSSNEGRERFDFISPLALKELASYLSTTENAFAQTNYMKGIPEDACIESLLRHINDYQINGQKKEAVALLFNAVALVHTIALKERGEYIKVQDGTKLVSESEYKNLQVSYDYKEK